MTIEEYWQVSEKPFLNTPDTKYLFESEDFTEAMGRILYNLEEIKGGITMIVGEIGCGKTILIHAVMEKLPKERYLTLNLINPRLSPNQLLTTIASGFGINNPPRYRNKILIELNDFLFDKNNKGITPVLLIDEAQTLPTRVLEEIRLLLNFEDRRKKLIQIVLVGQPELKRRIKEIEQLNQRVNIRYHLKGLNSEETAEYINHRLRVARAKREIFHTDALPLIHKYARGIPRLINTIATNSMYAGFLLKKEIIDGEIIEEVYKDITD
uniref:AAA family ATPase n=1 Tax=candidate division WOR-3 bacterium TaxID=2052148 RepID=A0A7C4TGL2_UNCW3